MAKSNSDKVQEFRGALNQRFLERSELIDGMLTALIAKEPLLMVGVPGTAKSMICKATADWISGKLFKKTLSKLTTPEEVFGPLSLKGLNEDRYTRKMDRFFPTADIVLMDEVFKASSAMLNTFLTGMNEREFDDDGKQLKIPMQTMYGASNELPQGEELGALFDRFVLRYYVESIQEDHNAETLFRGLPEVQFPTISLLELTAIQQEADKVTIPDAIIQALISLRRSVVNEGLFVSDRKWSQCIRVLKSYAFLNGNNEVTDDDLVILCNILWSTPEQRAQVRKLVGKVCNPISEKVLQIQDGVAQLYRDIQAKKTEETEGFSKMKHAVAELEKLQDKHPGNKKIERALEQVKKTYMEVAQKHLKLDLSMMSNKKK